MSEFSTKWSKTEFKTYLLLYFVNADFIESKEEKEVLKSKVNPDTLKNIHKEFDQDNDYQRIQKIIDTAERYNYTKENAIELLEKMKQLFFEKDSELGVLEENLLRGLSKLLT